jgi:phenylpropionate dioxygenase-like ring-hydroxylating dioxygenase large terminal subunit
MIHLFILLIFIISIRGLKIVTKPLPNTYQYNGNFFWKIGKSQDFKQKTLNRILFNDYPLCVYRDIKNEVVAISDICIHRGASISRGKLLSNNCLQCPYHGWEYKNGIVSTIPGLPETNKNFGTPLFETKEVNGDIFICPTYDLNSEKGLHATNKIFIPPEAEDSDFVRVFGKRKIKRQSKLITENVLDMMHISYVHTFGNQMSPIPFEIKYEDINEYAGKTTFHYTSGPTSMSRLLGNSKYVKVENEFYLPDTTVTRVFAGDIVKTIVTNCYSVNSNESILHFDLYRNFLTSSVFDGIFQKQMEITLDEDVKILNGIYDSYIKGFMNTKYDVTQLKFREKWNKNFIHEKKIEKKQKDV